MTVRIPGDNSSAANVWVSFVASFAAMVASLATMGAMLGLGLWLTDPASSFGVIFATPLLALLLGWFIWPLSTLLGLALFTIVGPGSSASEAPPKRRTWILRGAAVGLLVAVAMVGELWLRDAGLPWDWSMVAVLAGSAAVTGVIGLSVWRAVARFLGRDESRAALKSAAER